jgi:hypothetical protein
MAVTPAKSKPSSANMKIPPESLLRKIDTSARIVSYLHAKPARNSRFYDLYAASSELTDATDTPHVVRPAILTTGLYPCRNYTGLTKTVKRAVISTQIL